MNKPTGAEQLLVLLLLATACYAGLIAGGVI